jgi:predicted DNA binding protein
MKYVHLTVREPPSVRNPMHRFVATHDDMSLAQLLNWNVSHDEIDVLLFRVVGAVAPYVEALERAEFVRGYETAPIDADSFFVYLEHETRAADRQFRDLFRSRRLLVIPPIEFAADGATVVELVGRDAAVQAVLEAAPADTEVSIDRVRAYEHGLSASASLLTDRQLEALRVATDLGYYQIPRSGSVDDVADELGCAASTASDHLRKAEARLVGAVVD